MITEDKALKLLRRYIDNKKTINHCIGVSSIAYKIASKIKKKNPLMNIDPEKIKIAALLHDIGKCKKGIHEINTIEILKKEDLDDIAKITMHGFIYEIFLLKGDKNLKFLPQTIENKIVALSDMYFNQNEQRVNLKDRISDILERYNNDKDFIKAVELAIPRFERLENKINSLL
jgi:putative nucleotidyltransferase with HDIG domain